MFVQEKSPHARKKEDPASHDPVTKCMTMTRNNFSERATVHLAIVNRFELVRERGSQCVRIRMGVSMGVTCPFTPMGVMTDRDN